MNQIKIEIKWAIIFSVMGLAWMVLEKALGWHDEHIDQHMYLTNLFAIPAIVVVVMALKDKKKNFFSGSMSYMEGFKSGLIMTLIIAALSPLTQWITSEIITPEYFPNVIAYSVESGYHATVAEAEAQFNLSNYMLQGAIGALIMGIVTVAIAMIFLRTKKA